MFRFRLPCTRRVVKKSPTRASSHAWSNVGRKLLLATMMTLSAEAVLSQTNHPGIERVVGPGRNAWSQIMFALPSPWPAHIVATMCGK